jgi:hypothetical protein
MGKYVLALAVTVSLLGTTPGRGLAQDSHPVHPLAQFRSGEVPALIHHVTDAPPPLGWLLQRKIKGKWVLIDEVAGDWIDLRVTQEIGSLITRPSGRPSTKGQHHVVVFSLGPSRSVRLVAGARYRLRTSGNYCQEALVKDSGRCNELLPYSFEFTAKSGEAAPIPQLGTQAQVIGCPAPGTKGERLDDDRWLPAAEVCSEPGLWKVEFGDQRGFYFKPQ